MRTPRVLAALAGVIILFLSVITPATAFAEEEDTSPLPDLDVLQFAACRAYEDGPGVVYGPPVPSDLVLVMPYLRNSGRGTYATNRIYPVPAPENAPRVYPLFSHKGQIPCSEELLNPVSSSPPGSSLHDAGPNAICAILGYEKISSGILWWKEETWRPTMYGCGYICPVLEPERPRNDFATDPGFQPCGDKYLSDIEGLEGDYTSLTQWDDEVWDEVGFKPGDFADPAQGRVCVITDEGERVCGDVNPEDMGKGSRGKPITVNPGDGREPVTGVPDCTVTGGQIDTWVCNNPDADEGYSWDACIPDIDINWGVDASIDFDPLECITQIVTNILVPSGGTQQEFRQTAEEMKQMFPINVLNGVVETASRSSAEWNAIAVSSPDGGAWRFVVFGKQVTLMEQGSEMESIAKDYRTPITWIIITASAVSFAMVWAARSIFRVTDKS